MHKKIEMKAAKDLKRDAAKHTGKPKKEALSAAKILVKKAKKAHES